MLDIQPTYSYPLDAYQVEELTETVNPDAILAEYGLTQAQLSKGPPLGPMQVKVYRIWVEGDLSITQTVKPENKAEAADIWGKARAQYLAEFRAFDVHVRMPAVRGLLRRELTERIDFRGDSEAEATVMTDIIINLPRLVQGLWDMAVEEHCEYLVETYLELVESKLIERFREAANG